MKKTFLKSNTPVSIMNRLCQAEQNYREQTRIGRPHRRLEVVNGKAGLCCIQCQQIKPLNDFGFSDARRLYFESMCKDCKRQYHRDRKRKRCSL